MLNSNNYTVIEEVCDYEEKDIASYIAYCSDGYIRRYVVTFNPTNIEHTKETFIYEEYKPSNNSKQYDILQLLLNTLSSAPL
jgi:hypothetical protein